MKHRMIPSNRSLQNNNHHYYIGHGRNVRGLGKSMVVFRLLKKLRCSNERSTKSESLYHE